MTNQPLKLLFLRPPRHYWPILNEGDNFLLPLAYPTLAGYIRKFLPEIEIKILDCCAYQMGWKSLQTIYNILNFFIHQISVVGFCNMVA